MKPLRLLPILLLLLTACEAEPPEAPAPEAAATETTPTRTAAAEAPLPTPDEDTAQRFEAAMAYARAENLHQQPLGHIMQAIGEQFSGRPYMAGLLDEHETEMLVCRLDGFDCVTFVETALAMARGIQDQDYTYETFARHLRDQRYRGGRLDGYCSRLHYFSEWILDNEERGVVENITAELGGITLDKDIDFMTENRDKYPRFATNDSVYACVEQMEDRLADLKLYYLPQDRIREVYNQLQAGDIIATATDIEGLDVTHTGLVYDHGDGRKGFLHASLSDGVKISPDLQRYVQGVGSQIGVIVARPTAD